MPETPVISNKGTTTQHVSAFLGLHLKGIIPKISYIIRRHLRFTADNIPVTFDVVGLYPNKPHDERIETI